MMTSRGSNTKACILYVFECGEYGHRIELCPKQNQTDVENSPAAKEVLQTRIRKSGRNKGLSDLGCYLPTDVARGPRGQPKNQGPQDSKYPKGEGRMLTNPERSYRSGSQKRDACARVRNQPYFSLVERRHSVLAGVLSRIRSLFIGLLPCDTWQKRTQGHMPDLWVGISSLRSQPTTLWWFSTTEP